MNSPMNIGRSDIASLEAGKERRRAAKQTAIEDVNSSRSTGRENFLPFGKRPFGSRPISPLAQTPSCIFLIGNDAAFAKPREELLRKAGYKVRFITHGEAIVESRKSGVSISIFCHSLSSMQRVQVAASFLRNSPESRLILLSRGGDLNFEVMLFHNVISIEDGPEALIAGICRLTKDSKFLPPI